MNARKKASIVGGIMGAIVLVFVFTNIDYPFVKDIEFADNGKTTSQTVPHNVNSECELVNFINDGENLIEIRSFVQSNEEEFQDRFNGLGGGQTDPPDSQSVVRDGEIAKMVFADMVIEEFSINPDLRNFLIVSQEDSPQNLIGRVNKIDPNCQIGKGSLNPKFTPSSEPWNAGKLGSEHSHAGVLVVIFGDRFDFSVPSYQIKSSWIHFEGNDGTTIHKHATGVTLEYLFETLGLGLTDQCYEFQDGRSFCTNEDYSLKFFINGNQFEDIREYEIVDGDKILISYGAETDQEINQQLMELNRQQITV